MIHHISFMKYIFLAFLFCGLIGSCVAPANTTTPITASSQVAAQTNTHNPSKTVTVTDTPGPTSTNTLTQTPSNSPTPQEPSTTATPIETNSQTEFNIPILLYHHIKGETSTNRYQVSVPDFQSQMTTLHELGYQTISLSQFLDALNNGSTLPGNSVIITFDDGHLSVYENAFPIMEALGFRGVLYIVANRIYNSPDFINIEILQEMITAGWEIGSHGYSHADITQNHTLAFQEIAKSKIDLEKVLHVEIQTFAYPFGTFDTYVGQKVRQYGYQAGLGLGTSQQHTQNTQFYLSRIEIFGDESLTDFKQIFILD